MMIAVRGKWKLSLGSYQLRYASFGLKLIFVFAGLLEFIANSFLININHRHWEMGTIPSSKSISKASLCIPSAANAKNVFFFFISLRLDRIYNGKVTIYFSIYLKHKIQ